MTLREYLNRNGISQADFGRTADIDRTTMSRLVSGERLPAMDMALRIEKVTQKKVPMEVWAKAKAMARGRGQVR